jgi:sugar O-acyltransferase (sialic acid O-acetyltransferase NeuD family)
MKNNFYILGRSNATIAIILESLHRRFDGHLEVFIIENIPVNDDLPYDISGILTHRIPAETWHPLKNVLSGNNFIMGINNPLVKEAVYNFFSKQFDIQVNQYQNIIHDQSIQAVTVKTGHGVAVGPGSVIAPYAELKNMVSINRNVTVGHHTVIGEYCTINPGANIAGSCFIGKRVLIGMAANIVEQITIGENTIIGAGSLVTKSIPSNVICYGVPAKIIKENR